jgi:hypothetical protein
VSFMSARTDCTAGQAVPSAATALMNISRISPLGVEVAISRRIMVFWSSFAAEDFTEFSLQTRKLCECQTSTVRYCMWTETNGNQYL